MLWKSRGAVVAGVGRRKPWLQGREGGYGCWGKRKEATVAGVNGRRPWLLG